jgi:uncharacterized membrane protein
MESMKSSKKDASKDLSDPKDGKPEKEAKPDQKEKKAKKQKKEKGASEAAELPLLVELAFSLPVLVTLTVDVAVVLISVQAGASLVDILTHTMVTTVVIGALFLMVSWILSSGALTVAYKMQEGEQNLGREEQSENNASVDLTKAL